MMETGAITGVSVAHSRATVDQIEAAGGDGVRATVSDLLAREGVEEAFALQTCNRSEAYVVTDRTADGVVALETFAPEVPSGSVRRLGLRSVRSVEVDLTDPGERLEPSYDALLLDAAPDAHAGGDLGAARALFLGIGSLGPAWVGAAAQFAGYRVAFGGLTVCLVVSTGIMLRQWRRSRG